MSAHEYIAAGTAVCRTIRGSLVATVRWYDLEGPLPLSELIHVYSSLLLTGLERRRD